MELGKCLESILDVVGDSMSELQIKETIVRCEFDPDLALNTLLNNPMGSSSGGATFGGSSGGGGRKRAEKRAHLRPQPTPYSPPAAVAVSPAMIPAAVPAAVVVAPKQEGFGYAEVFLPGCAGAAAAAVAGAGVGITPNKSAMNGASEAKIELLKTPVSATKKANRLNIRSRSPSPGVSTPTVVPGSAVKMRKAKLDPVEMYESERGSKAETKAKSLLNLVVVGHVDSGKSTLMGHLLVELGQVSSRVMHKYENESKKLGKASFAFAWVLDETSEERERGITMDVGHSSFETKTKSVTLLDAPGHRDFIPNMISGAYQADVAVLVVNATRGEFEAGFDAGGQTREHALLVRSLGVSQLIVAVNKLDTVDWDQNRFNEIKDKLGKFLRQQVRFSESDVKFVPVSGLTGANLVKAAQHPWMVEGGVPTLMEAIDALRPPVRSIEKPFRMSVSDIFKPTAAAGGGLCVAGRIETGYVQKNDTVSIAPLNETATVKMVALDSLATTFNGNNNAYAGDHVSLTLTGVEQNVCQGMILCDPANPVKVSRHFAAKVVVLNVDMPVTKGFNCVLHHAGVTEAATVKKLVAQLSKSSGEVTKKKPRVLAKNSSALVEITTENLICLETYSESKELGRFMLRVGGKTIAAGMVTDIF